MTLTRAGGLCSISNKRSNDSNHEFRPQNASSLAADLFQPDRHSTDELSMIHLPSHARAASRTAARAPPLVRPLRPLWRPRSILILNNARCRDLRNCRQMFADSWLNSCWADKAIMDSTRAAQLADPPGGIPHLPNAVAREAYSHEVSSAGFWPGSGEPGWMRHSTHTPIRRRRALARRRCAQPRRTFRNSSANSFCPTTRCEPPRSPRAH